VLVGNPGPGEKCSIAMRGAHRLDYLADGLDEGFGHIIFSNSARRRDGQDGGAKKRRWSKNIPYSIGGYLFRKANVHEYA
jgi:hypothetical protein